MLMSEGRPRGGPISSTDNLRRQHATLLQIAAEIRGSFQGADTVVRDSYKLRTQLSALAGILSVHLAMEDGVMYPRLLVHQNPALRLLARRFVDDMGDLRRTFADYSHRWNTPEAMQAAPRDFIRESIAVLEALSQRIRREEHDLYPLVDQDEAPRQMMDSFARPKDG